QFHDDLPDPARPVPGISRLRRPAGRRRPATPAHRQGCRRSASRAAGEDQDRGVAMAGELISRDSLERIIQRAAELPAGEHGIGEGLTETELLSLGQDVGIPARHLRQALLEERTRSLEPVRRGVIAWLAGPERLSAQRVVPGDVGDVERSLGAWMEQYELLQMKRRYPDRISWDPKVGAFASIQRALGVAAVAALRAQRGQYEQVQIGLEQVLDRLERGEIRPEHALPGSRVNAFVRLADEIRSLMSPGTPPRG